MVAGGGDGGPELVRRLKRIFGIDYGELYARHQPEGRAETVHAADLVCLAGDG